MNSFDVSVLQPLLEKNCNEAVAAAWRAYLLTIAPELADEASQSLAYELMPYRNVRGIYEELVKRTSIAGYFDVYLKFLAELNLTLNYNARDLAYFSAGDYDISSACAMDFVERIYRFPRNDAAMGGLTLLSYFCNMLELYGNGGHFNDPRLLGSIHGLVATGELEQTMVKLAHFLMLNPEAAPIKA